MTKNNLIISVSIFVIVLTLLYYYAPKKTINFEGKVYKIHKDRYGYVVLNNKKVFIKQEIIPTIEGNVFFSDSIQAFKTLDIVLEKLNSGKNPTLSKDDLSEINIK